MKKLIPSENERMALDFCSRPSYVKYVTLLKNGIREYKRPEKSLQVKAKQMAGNFSMIN